MTDPHPPVVIGAGPAGLAAAWTLTEVGARPLILECSD
ncbi:NAD(P)-binding protein, partial [Nocardia gipuzkoensis]